MLSTRVLKAPNGRIIRAKSSGQKSYVETVRKNIVTFAIGPAGTGKTWLAVALAVEALMTKQVRRIVLTRPAVEAGERLGFLPGDLMAKVDPYLRPLYDAMYDMFDVEAAERLFEKNTVEVAPLAFMRGAHAKRQFYTSRRSSKHNAGTNEDVPYPYRVRLSRSGHRGRNTGGCPGG